ENPPYVPHRFPDGDLSSLTAVETLYQYHGKAIQRLNKRRVNPMANALAAGRAADKAAADDPNSHSKYNLR
ncbi:hypothetical protein A2U01_0042655, partial [Trifolium medium]|nr:hypothetical protein [Trifolium medium]